MSISEFFNMGGFALYVWSALGITLAFLLTEVIYLKQKRKAVIKRLQHIVTMNKRNKHENQA
jgi:heme exporter protein D